MVDVIYNRVVQLKRDILLQNLNFDIPNHQSYNHISIQDTRHCPSGLVGSRPIWGDLQQSSAAEACWAYNPEVNGSKPSSANSVFTPWGPLDS